MMHDFVVRLQLRQFARKLTRLNITAQAKLRTDQPGHPSGQWSVVVNLWSAPDEHGVARAWLDFASPDAPKTMVFQGDSFPLFIGPNLIADVDVLKSRHHESAVYDIDFLADRRARPRNAAGAKGMEHDATV